MRMMTWLFLFVIAFFIALVLVLTFMQPEFKKEVGAQVLMLHTKPFPVYLYVLGAFLAGLALGMGAALYNFIRAKAGGLRMNRQIRELERQLADTKRMMAVHSEMASLMKAAEERE
jgi:hypothetical protein